jgi:hypothetical protein
LQISFSICGDACHSSGYKVLPASFLTHFI